jgi:hypothetical protein
MLLLASTFLSHSMLVQADFTTNHTLAEKESYQWLVDLVPGFGDWNHYLNYSEMVGLLERLNYTYPSIAKVFSIGKSWQNREIYCIELTGNKSGGVKPQVLLVGLHHARESISAELPLYFAVLATSNYGTSSPMTSLLDCSDIFLIPALNVDGLDLVKVNEWQRKNACPLDDDGDGLVDENPPSDLNHDGHLELVINSNGNCSQWVEGIDSDGDGQISEDWVGGVDLNRNYGFEWDNPLAASSDTFPSSDVYRGPQPFSEPETRALRDLALNHDFKYAVSFHSGSECIIYPWGYTATPTLDDKLFREVAGNMSKLVGASAFQGGAGLYTVSGELGDWMYANRSTYAFTCEMFQNASAWHQDIIQEGLSSPKVESYGGVFESCNPNPREIVSTVKKWLPVIPYVTIRAVGYVPPTHLSPPLEPTVVHFVATAMTPDVYPGLMILLASVLVSVRFRSRKIEKQRKSDSPSPKYQDPISRLSLSDH